MKNSGSAHNAVITNETLPAGKPTIVKSLESGCLTAFQTVFQLLMRRGCRSSIVKIIICFTVTKVDHISLMSLPSSLKSMMQLRVVAQ